MSKLMGLVAVLVGCHGTAEPRQRTVSSEDPTFDDVLAAFPACTAVPGDGDLDLETLCAGQICADQDFQTIDAAIGPATCEAGTFEDLHCSWQDGMEGYFADQDGDGAGDPGDPIGVLIVGAPYAGSTAGGLGLGVEASCFLDGGVWQLWVDVDAFGEPWLESVYSDWGAATDSDGDGLVDRLSLF